MRAVLISIVVFAAALAVGEAQAVKPGKNGAIYFQNFNADTQSSEIYAINPNGSGLRAVTKTQNVDETEPAVSPNGKQIAFLSNASLHIMNANGGGERAVRAGGVEQGSPAWSPNGKLMAFSRCVAVDPDGGECTNAQIAVIAPNSSKPKLLSPRVAGAVDSRPSWAPDGKRIVFQRMNADGIVSLWTANATRTAVRRILNDGSDVDHSPTYTPDGKRVVYYSDAGGHEAIWQIQPDGHGAAKLFSETPDPDDPTTGSGTENPSVSPNGKLIVYTAGGDLWTATTNGSNRTQLTKNGGDEADWARG